MTLRSDVCDLPDVGELFDVCDACPTSAQACGVRPALPAWLADLLERKERATAMPVDQGALERFILAASRAAREGAAA